MKYILLTPNADGKFEFTKEELQKLLDDVYEQGKKDAPPNYVPVYDSNKGYQWNNGWTITCTGESK